MNDILSGFKGIDERAINGGTWNKRNQAIWLNGWKAVFRPLLAMGMSWNMAISG